MTRAAVLNRCLAIARDHRLGLIGWVELESRFSDLAGALADDGPATPVPLDPSALLASLRLMTADQRKAMATAS